MPADTYVCGGWACTDCLILLANGENPPGWTDDEISAWHADIARRNAGYNVTLGKIREDHACATNYTVTTYGGNEYEYRAEDEFDARGQFVRARTVGNIPALAIKSVTEHELRAAGDDGNECDCERDTFSSAPCDYCGSGLGGERHAISFFTITSA